MSASAATPASAGGPPTPDPLLSCLRILTTVFERPVPEASLAAGLPLDDEPMTAELFVRAATAQGIAARVVKRRLTRISPLLLPVVLLLRDGEACVLLHRGRRRVTLRHPDQPDHSREMSTAELARLYTGYCILAHPRPEPDDRTGVLPDATPTSGWFWRTLWRFRSYYIEAVVAASLINVLALATALYVMNVYDRVVPNNATESLIVLATGTFMAIAFEFLARTVRSYLLDSAARKADVLLASRLFQQAMSLRMEERPGSSGAFASQLREFESLRDFCTSATLAVLTDVPFVAFFIWVISLIGGPLYLIPLVAVPGVVVIGLILQIPLSFVMRKHMRESSLRHGLLVESVENTEAVKTLGAEGRLLRRFESYSALTGSSSARSRMISSAMINVTMLVQQCITVSMVLWGVFLIGAGDLTVGALIACVILTGRGLAPLSQLASLMVRYQQARSAYLMFDELMRKPVERPEGRRFLARARIRPSFAFQDVAFAYPGQEIAAIDGLNLRIEQGERIGVLGRVGSGKSTLLRLALGLYRPVSGTVMLDGVDLQQLDPAVVRRHVALVSQTPQLFYGSLRDNLVLGAPGVDDETLLEVAEVVGLLPLVSQHPQGLDLPVLERGEGLSGGQRQAVSLARALVLEPRALLMDEPTSAMDHNTESRFLAALAQLGRDRTMLMATHKPSLLAVVDRLLVLEGGKLVMDGPRDRILRELSGNENRGASAGSGAS